LSPKLYGWILLRLWHGFFYPNALSVDQHGVVDGIIRRINIKDSEAEIEYTCPIGLGGNRSNEILSMARIGSKSITAVELRRLIETQGWCFGVKNAKQNLEQVVLKFFVIFGQLAFERLEILFYGAS
jgi:hypothetical protein